MNTTVKTNELTQKQPVGEKCLDCNKPITKHYAPTRRNVWVIECGCDNKSAEARCPAHALQIFKGDASPLVML